MNVASLELCRDLFALSGWGQSETHLTYYDGDLDETEPWDRGADNRKNIPAYDLGYLLRKLPATIRIEQSSEYGTVTRWWFHWLAVPKAHEANEGKLITEVKPTNVLTYADTPEDAACKLAIELFQHGILKRERAKM